MKENYAAVTGIGGVTPIGNSLNEIESNLLSGKSGIGLVRSFDTGELRSHLGGETVPFDPSSIIPKNRLRRLDAVSQMGIAAAHYAMTDANLTPEQLSRTDAGIILGTGFGSTTSTDGFFTKLIKEGPGQVNPSLFPNTVPNACAGNMAIHFKLKGINTTFSHKETSAEAALCYATSMIKQGAADYLIVGGIDELCPFLYFAYHEVKALSPRNNYPHEGLRPYDKRANGLVLGSGAGMLIVESLKHAELRNANIYAVISGAARISCTQGPFSYDGRHNSYVESMRRAIEISGLSPERISFIHGAANGTEILDAAEVRAVLELYDKYDALPPLTSTKSFTGHFDGFGGLKTLFSCLAIKNDFIPPTPNLEFPRVNDRAPYVMKTVHTKIEHVLMNAFSNGGANLSIVLSSPDSL